MHVCIECRCAKVVIVTQILCNLKIFYGMRAYNDHAYAKIIAQTSVILMYILQGTSSFSLELCILHGACIQRSAWCKQLIM